MSSTVEKKLVFILCNNDVALFIKAITEHRNTTQWDRYHTFHYCADFYHN